MYLFYASRLGKCLLDVDQLPNDGLLASRQLLSAVELCEPCVIVGNLLSVVLGIAMRTSHHVLCGIDILTSMFDDR